jgi:hypothetical protein
MSVDEYTIVCSAPADWLLWQKQGVAKLHHSKAHSWGNVWKPCKAGPEKVKQQ